MTRRQFYGELSRLPYDWFLTWNGEIRGTHQEGWSIVVCPISAFWDWDSSASDKVAEEGLELDPNFVFQLHAASDHPPHGYRRPENTLPGYPERYPHAVRTALLRRLGLTEIPLEEWEERQHSSW